jgi:hypothetical protein
VNVVGKANMNVRKYAEPLDQKEFGGGRGVWIMSGCMDIVSGFGMVFEWG